MRAAALTAVLLVFSAAPSAASAASGLHATQVPAFVPVSLVNSASLVKSAEPFATPTAAMGTEAMKATPRSVGFLQRQLDYPRVQRAYERKAERVEEALDARGVEDVGEVFFRVFKREQELEVWAREPGVPTFTLVKTYPICEVSGRLGPKRSEGDLQIPEGFYSIDIFNPWSDYHLSMRVDYPNAVDRARGQADRLGGDIYIHGGCVTIGCVPVTDEYIEELYLVAATARDAGQYRIPVHIFPTRLDDAGLSWLADNYGTRYVDYAFWMNLQQGYLAFERTRTLPAIGYDGRRYTFTAPGTLAPQVEVASIVPGPLGTPAAVSTTGVSAAPLASTPRR